jgi:hypothetical protein
VAYIGNCHNWFNRFPRLALSVKASTFPINKVKGCASEKGKVVKMSKQLKLKLPVHARVKHAHEQQKLTDKQQFGLNGEKFEAYVTSTALKNVYEVKHNDWKTYVTSQEKGCDIKVVKGKDVIFVIEVKNWRLKRYQWGIKHAYEQIVTRFTGFEDSIKILFISFKRMLTEGALKMLAKHHIHVFEVGQTFSIASNNPKVNPTFFYETVDKFRDFITDLTKTRENFSGIFSFVDCVSKYIKSDVNEQLINFVKCEYDTDILDMNNTINFTDININQLINQSNQSNKETNQLNQLDKRTLDNSSNNKLHSDSNLSVNSLITDRNKQLIDNPEHDSWLEERINALIASVS